MTRLCLILLFVPMGSPGFAQEFTLLGDKPKAVKTEPQAEVIPVKPPEMVPLPVKTVDPGELLADKPVVPTPDLILPAKVQAPKEVLSKTDFSLMGKEVQGSNPEYFRIDTPGGKTFLLLPSTGADFSIDGFPVVQSPAIQKLKSEDTVKYPETEKTVEPEAPKQKISKTGLKLYSYSDAHAASVVSLRPLIVFALSSEQHVDSVNEKVESLLALGAGNYFHIAVIDGTDPMYKPLVKDNLNPTQVVVWWYKDKTWNRRVYFGDAGTYDLYRIVKDWVINRKDNALLDIRLDFSAILFSVDEFRKFVIRNSVNPSV